MSFIRRIWSRFETRPPELHSQRESLGLPTTTLDSIRVTIPNTIKPASCAEVDSVAQALNTTFPQYYREYVCRFGYGVLGGKFVRINLPLNIQYELAEFRERIAEYWFWGDGHSALPKERVLESIRIGDTLQGDELVFHPSDPSKIFCLPRGGPTVHFAGPDLVEAIDWLCSSGILTQPFKKREFNPA